MATEPVAPIIYICYLLQECSGKILEHRALNFFEFKPVRLRLPSSGLVRSSCIYRCHFIESNRVTSGNNLAQAAYSA